MARLGPLTDASYVPVGASSWAGSPDVPHDEDEVEPGQNGCHEIDVFSRALEVVVAAVNRVRGREH